MLTNKMSNVQIIPFSIIGDLNILKNKEPELDVDSIEAKKAILYSAPEVDDSADNVNIILKLAPNGMYVFTNNLNETSLRKILQTCTIDNDEFTLEKLRYLLRYKLLDFSTVTDYEDAFDNSILVNNYELETQLVIEDSGIYYYKVFLNEKIVTADSLVAAENNNDYSCSLNKRICEFTILESTSDDLSAKHPDLNTEDYLYLSCDLNKRKNLQIQLFRTRMMSQSEEINFLKNKIEMLRKAYREKIDTIEDISIKLVNFKKEKIRILIDKLEGWKEFKSEKDFYDSSLNDLSFIQGDRLNSMVETTDSEAEEEAGEDEETYDNNENDKRKNRKRARKNKEPTKRMKRKFADKILNRKKESFSRSIAETDSENSQQSAKTMNDYTDTFTDEDSIPVLKEEPTDVHEDDQQSSHDMSRYDEEHSHDQSENLQQVADKANVRNAMFKKKFISTPNDLSGPSFESDYKFARQGNHAVLNKNHANYLKKFHQIPERQENDSVEKSFDRSVDENYASSRDSDRKSVDSGNKGSFVKQEFPEDEDTTMNAQTETDDNIDQNIGAGTQIDNAGQNMSTDIEDSSD